MSLSKALLTIGSLVGARQAAKAASRFETDGLLGRFGLQRHRPASQAIVASIGMLSLGASVGAIFALLIAPTSGAALRGRFAALGEGLVEKMATDNQSTSTRERERDPSGRFRSEKSSL